MKSVNVRGCLQGLFLSVLVTGLALPAVRAQDSPAPAIKVLSGAIVGIVTDSAKRPVAGATVTAVRVDGGGIRATVSGNDGLYSFADVPPGTWSVTVQVEGYPDAVVPSLQVVASKASRRDIAMNVPAAGPTSGAAPALAAEPGPGRFPAAPAVAQTAITVPEALQAPPPGPEVDLQTPFAVGDIGWMNGTPREKAPIFDTKFFTPEIRLDMNYLQSGNHPIDHTIVGSTEEFRSGEFQIEQVSFGGDFHWEGVKARFLSMFGMFATTTPRNDASSAVGQWDLDDAYRYFSEANAGYHFDVNHGLNVDVGVFVSYIGLFSYYNYDNWTYQPSFVSSNTPWFFNGLRVQWWPTQTLKIEPWLINGWQSYAKFNSKPGFGGQILWIPNDSFKLVLNSYSIGQDNLDCQTNNPTGSGTVDTLCHPQNGGNSNAAVGSYVGAGGPVDWSRVKRIHEDDSVLVKYYDAHGKGGDGVSKMAFSYTVDIGCEYGGGVTCSSGQNKENFFGMMLYDRTWFHNDLYAVTIGGGFMNNPGRYLALTPPINGATAATGSPYFTQAPGQKLYQWDSQLNFQYMPKDWITWWTETTFRHSSVPYWSGSGGVTPPGGNTGSPGSCVGGGSNATTGQCDVGDWFPDLRTREVIWGAGVLVKF
jgi:Putative beta-barrel porin-2, OmpL-like. bbp2/Carboxypeptidase regulatory-like domain